METKAFRYCNFELKELDAKQGIVQFYAASYDEDRVKDTIPKSAFLKTVSENKDNIRHYYNHNQNKVPGIIQNLELDNKGLLVTSKLLQTTLGRDTLIEYEYKAIKEHSIGYGVYKDKIESKSNGGRILKEIILYECSSLTKQAANGNTPMVSLKDFSENEILEQAKSINEILHKSSISDARALQLEKEFKKIVIYLKSLQPSKITAEPMNGKNQLTIKAINEFKIF